MRRLGGRPVYGVVGYTHDGAAYCPACAEACEDVPVEDGEVTDGSMTGPIFRGDEWGRQPRCAVRECERELDVTVLERDRMSGSVEGAV